MHSKAVLCIAYRYSGWNEVVEALIRKGCNVKVVLMNKIDFLSILARKLSKLPLRIATSLSHLLPCLHSNHDVLVLDPIIVKARSAHGIVAAWAKDTHTERGFKSWALVSRSFDVVFTPHLRSMIKFRRLGVKSVWLPYAADTNRFWPLNVKEKYDVVFVGSLNATRASFLKRLLELARREHVRLKIFVGRAWGAKYRIVTCSGKVVLNIPRFGELNRRVFEVLAMRKPLVTYDNLETRTLFEDGVHLMTYDSPESCLKKILDLLDDDELRRRIADNGYREVSAKHTYDNRIETLLKHISEI